MPLINCEVNLISIWSSTCVITNSTGAGRFAITDTKLYVSVITLLAQNPNLNHLVEPSFQGVNRLFVLAFENDTKRTSHSGYSLPNIEIKNYNLMINGENFFDQIINNNKVAYENIRKIATGQGDDYTTGCLLDYPYFKDNYKMIAVDLSKQQALDVNPRAFQQINFTANLDRAGNTGIYFILARKSKRNYSKFCTRYSKSIVNMI